MQTHLARNWETAFGGWIGKASDSEQERYERTCRAIGDALRADERLGQYDFSVYPKGSYPNFTNVVRDSDVDIAVELTTFSSRTSSETRKDSTSKMSASPSIKATQPCWDSRMMSSMH